MEEETKQRIMSAAKEIDEVLKKYEVKLNTAIQVADARPVASVETVVPEVVPAENV